MKHLRLDKLPKKYTNRLDKIEEERQKIMDEIIFHSFRLKVGDPIYSSSGEDLGVLKKNNSHRSNEIIFISLEFQAPGHRSGILASSNNEENIGTILSVYEMKEIYGALRYKDTKINLNQRKDTILNDTWHFQHYSCIAGIRVLQI